KKPEKPTFKIPVTIEEIKRGRMYAYLQAVGTVTPVKEIEIKPEMNGRIYFSQRWKEGDEVKKGTVLANMDDRELQLNINDAELNLEIARAKVRPASAQLEQAIKEEQFKEAMYKRGAISKADFDLSVLQRIQRENQYQETLSNIEAHLMALKKQKQETEKVEIVLPFNGVLLPPGGNTVSSAAGKGGEVDLTLMNGQTVGASTILCRLANIDTVYVALDVPAKDLIDINVGQDVEIDVYSKSGRAYRGTVAEISTSLNANTRTYTVNVLVENPEHELRPGMFAKARIITKEKLDAVSIPRDLVLLRNNKNVVFVVEEKPMDAVENATGEIQVPDAQSGPNPQIAMTGAPQVDSTGEEPEEDVLEAEAEEAAPAPQPDLIARECEIELGIQNRERVEVISGLKEGDLLVVLGYETLSDKVDVNASYRKDLSNGIQLPEE
ncbi:MAG: efflux RND transporter periplasmic adaptor subunit, partial [bacterium]|nr:efflux RND transporter periplasmic adaptor subunit [bacterium]